MRPAPTRPRAPAPARPGRAFDYRARAAPQAASRPKTGAEAFAAWARASAAPAQAVAMRRDADGPTLDQALDLVRQFIKDRGLIIFGGLAIDYALRLKGARIYPDGQRPDFDFISPRSVDDAYDLADLLHAAGFADVGTIRAIHVQTMRVRTSFLYVADIGYAPPEVFERIPTFDYMGLRVVHPDYQRLDLHLAFCFPLNGPPREDVFHRWRKDLERFNLFERHWPVAPPAPAPPAPGRRVTARLAVPVCGDAGALGVALQGFAAYAVLRGALDELAASLGGGAPAALAAVKAPRLWVDFPDAHTVAVETPVGDRVVVAGPDPEAAVAGLPGGARRYAPYMDTTPESLRTGTLEVLSTRGRLLAVSVVRAAGGRQVLVATPQYLLYWLLGGAHTASADADRGAYLEYYAHTLEILRVAEGLCCSAGGDEGRALLDLFAGSPFAPAVTTLGRVNTDTSYVIRMATNSQRLRDAPPASLGLDPDVARLLEGLPQNYYPATSRRRPEFDYGGSSLFRRAGQPVEAPPTEKPGAAGRIGGAANKFVGPE